MGIIACHVDERCIAGMDQNEVWEALTGYHGPFSLRFVSARTCRWTCPDHYVERDGFGSHRQHGAKISWACRCIVCVGMTARLASANGAAGLVHHSAAPMNCNDAATENNPVGLSWLGERLGPRHDRQGALARCRRQTNNLVALFRAITEPVRPAPMITNFIFIRCGQILYRAAISRGHGCLGREREALGRSGRTEGF
jgi:hypothetical protein